MRNSQFLIIKKCSRSSFIGRIAAHPRYHLTYRKTRSLSGALSSSCGVTVRSPSHLLSRRGSSACRSRVFFTMAVWTGLPPIPARCAAYRRYFSRSLRFFLIKYARIVPLGIRLVNKEPEFFPGVFSRRTAGFRGIGKV